MQSLSDSVLQRFKREASLIITSGSGPCPVFARGDRRTVATDWLSRDMVHALEADGILTPVPGGLALSQTAGLQRRDKRRDCGRD